MFRLSVCAETVFRDLPFIERVRAIRRAGFLVEFWRREWADIEAIAADPDIRVSTMSGSDEGSMMNPEGAGAFLDGVNRRLLIAETLGCRELNLLAGALAEDGSNGYTAAGHPATMWITAYKTLCTVAEIAEKAGVVYNLEPLNTKVDHPGYPLPRVEDAVRLLEQVGSLRIKLLLDVYHAQVQEGNVIGLIRQFHPHIGYVHVADAPGRHEPGTGEIDFPAVAQALAESGYCGTIGLEAFPRNGDHLAMSRFREIFGRVPSCSDAAGRMNA